MADWKDYRTALSEGLTDFWTGALLPPGTEVIASPRESARGIAAQASAGNGRKFQELGFAWSQDVRETLWMSPFAQLLAAQKLLHGQLTAYVHTFQQNFDAWNDKFPNFEQLQDSSDSVKISMIQRIQGLLGGARIDSRINLSEKLSIPFRDMLLRNSGMPQNLCESIQKNKLQNEESRQFLACFESLQQICVYRITARKRRVYLVFAACTPMMLDPPSKPGETASIRFQPASSAFAASVVSWLWEVGFPVLGDVSPSDRLFASLVCMNGWEPNVRGWLNDDSWVMLAAPSSVSSAEILQQDWKCLCPQTFTKSETLRGFLDILQPTNFHAEVYRIREEVLRCLNDITYRGDVREIDVSRALNIPKETVKTAFQYLNGSDSFELYTVDDGDKKHLALRMNS